MKRFIIFGRLYTLLIFAVPVQVTAQDPDPFPNYVVRGASAHHKTSVSGKAANSHQVLESEWQPDMASASAIIDKAPERHVEDIPNKVSAAPCPGESQGRN